MDDKVSQIKVSPLGVKDFNEDYIKKRQLELSEMKESGMVALLKFPPSKLRTYVYNALRDATDEWVILFRSAQVVDMIVDFKKR